MENHQQALLVVLSYVIGFITAFIMFGLAADGKDKKQTHSSDVTDAAAIQEVVEEAPRVEETEEGLFLMVNGEQKIISALTGAEEADAGFHVAIITSMMSPDNNYVLYCSQMDSTIEVCQHFVYSVADHKTFMVKNDDETALVTANEEAGNVFWTDASEITLEGKVGSAESLWILR